MHDFIKREISAWKGAMVLATSVIYLSPQRLSHEQREYQNSPSELEFRIWRMVLI